MGIITTVMKQRLTNWDQKFFTSIFRLNGRTIIANIARIISHSGNGYLYPIMGLLGYLASSEVGMTFVLSGLMAYSVELPIYYLVKNTVKRNRPYDVLKGITNLVVPIDKFSFPSGHTAGATVAAVLVWYFFPALGLLTAVWAGTVAFARICVGVHYPTDIIAGALLGGMSSMASIWIVG